MLYITGAAGVVGPLKRIIKIRSLLVTVSACVLLFISQWTLSENHNTSKIIQLFTMEWEPYTGRNLPNHGVFSELVTESLSRVGYEVEFNYYPWVRGIRTIREGGAHGIMNIYWNQERTNFLEYPDAVITVNEMLVALKKSELTYEQLMNPENQYTIGLLRGSLQEQALADIGIKVSGMNYQEQNVRKLISERVDAIIIPREILLHQIKKVTPNFPTSNLKIFENPYKIHPMYVAFSKKIPGYRQLATDFNRGLSQIKTDGTYKRIIEKHQRYFPQ